MIENGMRPIHPGELLREEFLIPLGMSLKTLSMHLRIPVSRINGIVQKRSSVTPDIAVRLARFFGGDAQSWLNLQTAFDLRSAERKRSLQNPPKTIAPEQEKRLAD